MLEAFKVRKPWATAIIALILGPVIGMCYVNRGRLAFTYFVVAILLMSLPFIAAQMGILPIHPVDALGIVSWGLNIIGAVHCFQIAKQHNYLEPFKWYSHWYALVAIIILVPLLIAFTFRQFCYQPFNIPSSSMSPNVNKGDYLFAQKFAYNTKSPARGDVIIFKVNNLSYIKRVVGLPGDRIQIKDGVLYINDVAVPRQPIEDYAIQYSKGMHTVDQFTEKMPEGKEYKVLAESNNAASDNTPLYTVPANSYFVLGDNRDQSHDSRHQDFGFIPRQNVTGKASFIFWNDSTRKLQWETVN